MNCSLQLQPVTHRPVGHYNPGTNGPSENLPSEAVIQGTVVADVEHSDLAAVGKLGSVLIGLISRRISNVKYKEYHVLPCTNFG